MFRSKCFTFITNRRGQSAILVAMMFNVLFVFFAMAINVGMTVHDKINLQNSVDLAAYYAASKQAEILNVIAHENYMIRQSWKLLAWRYRVLGTMGMIDNQFVNPAHTGDTSDTLYPPAQNPSVCMTYQPNWQEVPAGENLCRRPDVSIPPLPQVKVIAGFLGLNQGIAALSTQLIAQFNAQCRKHGAFNWWFAMSIMQAFRIDQRNRMQVIEALANDLSQDKNGDFTDLDGNSVLQGAQQTFQKNLTFNNKNTMQNFTLVNGLAGIDPAKWLPKVTIAPTILYTDVDNSNGCNAVNREIADTPHEQAANQIIMAPWPQGLQAGDLFQWASQMDSVSLTSDYQFTLGVEKNPWYEAYMGVTASSAPREVFFPVAGAVSMTARAYAKPFGGRIGPWYADQWPKGGDTSTGNPIDGLVPPRVSGSTAVDSTDYRRLPNYSRFPGDKLGMMSALSQDSITNLGNFHASYGYYINIKADFQNGAANDVMAWDGGSGPDIRFMEMAAIAPDLFDATYYSVEPDFEQNYLTRLQANATALGIPSTTVIRPDLGFNGTSSSFQQFSVQDQMLQVQQRQLQKQEAYYFIRDKANLLTAWLPGVGAFNYDTTQSLANFGKCQRPDDSLKYKNPGSCVAGGGRTGYSTKLVSRDLLLNEQPLGGANGSSGVISNPPQN